MIPKRAERYRSLLKNEHLKCLQEYHPKISQSSLVYPYHFLDLIILLDKGKCSEIGGHFKIIDPLIKKKLQKCKRDRNQQDKSLL